MYLSWGVSFIGLKSEKRSDSKTSSYPSTFPPQTLGLSAMLFWFCTSKMNSEKHLLPWTLDKRTYTLSSWCICLVCGWNSPTVPPLLSPVPPTDCFESQHVLCLLLVQDELDQVTFWLRSCTPGRPSACLIPSRTWSCWWLRLEDSGNSDILENVMHSTNVSYGLGTVLSTSLYFFM